MELSSVITIVFVIGLSKREHRPEIGLSLLGRDSGKGGSGLRWVPSSWALYSCVPGSRRWWLLIPRSVEVITPGPFPVERFEDGVREDGLHSVANIPLGAR